MYHRLDYKHDILKNIYFFAKRKYLCNFQIKLCKNAIEI